MTLDDARPGLRRVAVGHSRQAAVTVFGRKDDDLFATSYADFEREVDLATVTSLDVVLGEGSAHVLQLACERAASGECIVRLAVRPGEATALGSVLDSAGLTVVDVETVAGTALLSIAPGAAGHSAPVTVVLAALRAGAESEKHPPTGPEPAPPPTSPSRRRPTPTLVHTLGRVDRWRRGRRRRTAVLGALAVALLALLLVGLLPRTPQALVSIGVPLLVAIGVVAGAVSTYTTLVLARQVDRQNRRLERQLARTRDLVQTRTQGLAQRLARVEQGQSRLPFLEQYVEAIAEHGAATSGRLRDLLDEAGPDQEADQTRPS